MRIFVLAPWRPDRKRREEKRDNKLRHGVYYETASKKIIFFETAKITEPPRECGMLFFSH